MEHKLSKLIKGYKYNIGVGEFHYGCIYLGETIISDITFWKVITLDGCQHRLINPEKVTWVGFVNLEQEDYNIDDIPEISVK